MVDDVFFNPRAAIAAEHPHVGLLRLDDKQVRKLIHQPLVRGVLTGDQKDAQLADKGFGFRFAARVLHIPNGLGHLSRAAPHANPERSGIRFIGGGNDRIRSLAVFALADDVSVTVACRIPIES